MILIGGTILSVVYLLSNPAPSNNSKVIDLSKVDKTKNQVLYTDKNGQFLYDQDQNEFLLKLDKSLTTQGLQLKEIEDYKNLILDRYGLTETEACELPIRIVDDHYFYVPISYCLGD